MARTLRTPLNRPSQGNTAVAVEVDPEGGKRADEAGKGRVTQVNSGHSRSPTVTRKPALTRDATL
jgi:hypothetical protein